MRHAPGLAVNLSREPPPAGCCALMRGIGLPQPTANPFEPTESPPKTPFLDRQRGFGPQPTQFQVFKANPLPPCAPQCPDLLRSTLSPAGQNLAIWLRRRFDFYRFFRYNAPFSTFPEATLSLPVDVLL